MNIYETAKKAKEELVRVRRYLHQHPEASMKEFQTTDYIRSYLDEKQIPWIPAGETGTVAVINGNTSGRVIGLRGDIDALEMDELRESPYCSQNPGLMHACGHDGHTASLLGAAVYLQEHRNEIPGTVKLIFQPGEENGKGARSVVESGSIDDVEGIFGLHVSSSLPTGTATIRKGVMSTANDKFKIRIKGKRLPWFGAAERCRCPACGISSGSDTADSYQPRERSAEAYRHDDRYPSERYSI